MNALLILALILVSWNAAMAKAPCRSPSQFRDIANTRSKMGDSDRPSTRMFVDQYAAFKNVTRAKIQEDYGGTGDFQCGLSASQAQVTVTDTVITTAGHSLFKKDCTPLDFSKCNFTVEVEGKRKTVSIKRLIESQFDCKNTEATKDDWAVLELTVAVPVKPYPINRSATLAINRSSHLLSIGRSIDMAKKGATGTSMTDYPRHYTECHLTEIEVLWQGDDPDLFKTNCSGDSLNSGGTLLDRDSSTLVGIMVQSDKDKKSRYVPVSGRLYTVLSGLQPAK